MDYRHAWFFPQAGALWEEMQAVVDLLLFRSEPGPRAHLGALVNRQSGDLRP